MEQRRSEEMVALITGQEQVTRQFFDVICLERYRSCRIGVFIEKVAHFFDGCSLFVQLVLWILERISLNSVKQVYKVIIIQICLPNLEIEYQKSENKNEKLLLERSPSS